MEVLITALFVGVILFILAKTWLASLRKEPGSSVSKPYGSESPPRDSDSPAPKPQQNLKTYSIFTLGTSGAGKTCFMASMFHRLSLYKPDIGFYLEVPDNRQRILLTSVYSKMTDPYSDWPAGTVNETQWRFRCVVSANGNNYPVFQFNYIDYAGGHLTEHSQADSFDAQAKVSEADAVLAILDGQKILRRLEDREHIIEDPGKRIGAELNFMLP